LGQGGCGRPAAIRCTCCGRPSSDVAAAGSGERGAGDLRGGRLGPRPTPRFWLWKLKLPREHRHPRLGEPSLTAVSASAAVR
jgi:hypothetical protein